LKPTNNEKQFFLSPLEKFKQENCERCPSWKGNCRLDDQNGMKRMELCIRLYCHNPPDVTAILNEAQQALKITEETGLETLQEAEVEA